MLQEDLQEFLSLDRLEVEDHLKLKQSHIDMGWFIFLPLNCLKMKLLTRLKTVVPFLELSPLVNLCLMTLLFPLWNKESNKVIAE